MQIAARAGDAKAVLFDCREMRTACDEGNVVTCRCKACPEITAEAASPHDDNAHGGIQRGIAPRVKTR
jgi:hypothetical protein